MTFEQAISKFSRESLEKEYIISNKSKEQIAKEIGISQTLLRRVFNHYGIAKPKEAITSSKLLGAQKSNASKKERTQSSISNIDRDELYRLYITENTRYDDIAKHFGISHYALDSALRLYGIHKSKKQSHSLGNETKEKKYGSIAEYHKQARAKAVDTILRSHESVQEYYSDVAKKMMNTKEQRYGVRSYNNRNLAEQTCLSKYGVPAPCMLPQARMSGNDSAPNRDFAERLDKVGIEYAREFSLESYSYDFKIGNILVEVDPTIAHNSSYSPFPNRKPLDMHYHEKKSLCAKNRGYRCIHIWDWDDVDKVVWVLQKRQKVNARDCEVRNVSKEETARYLNKYHLQGYANDEIRLGLFFDDALVMVMTFGAPRYNKNFQFELIRLCSHCYVVGGAEKLFKYFVKTYTPNSVVSYCDLAKFEGCVYEKLGFEYAGYQVSKHWYNPQTGRHITDALLRARGADQLLGTNHSNELTNKQIMLLNGFVEVYDCGQARFGYYKH